MGLAVAQVFGVAPNGSEKFSRAIMMCAMGFFLSWLNQLIFSFTLFTREDDRCQFVNPLTHKKERQTLHFYFLLWIFCFEKNKALNSSIFPLSRSTYMRTATQSPYYIDDAFIDLIIKPTHFTITQDRCSSDSSHYFSIFDYMFFFSSLRVAFFFFPSFVAPENIHTLASARERSYFLFIYELEIVTNSWTFTIHGFSSYFFTLLLYLHRIVVVVCFFFDKFLFFLLTTWSEQHTKHSVFSSSLFFTSLSELFWVCTFKSINVWCYFTEARRRRMCRYAKVRRSPELFSRLARVYTISRGGQFIFSRECRAACAKTTCTASVFQTVTELIVWRFE